MLVRRRHGRVQVGLESAEAAVVAALAGQVATMLDGDDTAAAESSDPLEALAGSVEPVPAPDDPALRRLLPDAYPDDDESALEFRRLMDGELRRTKSTALRDLVVDMATAEDAEHVVVTLTDERAELWLQALNDVRLVLGVRLDVTEDLDEIVDGLGPDDPRLPLLAAYDLLSHLQAVLVDALDE